MKIHIDLPWGGCFEFECEPRRPREPLDWDKFRYLCYLAAGVAAAVVILGFVYLVGRR